jgi:hypothetical protein
MEVGQILRDPPDIQVCGPFVGATCTTKARIGQGGPYFDFEYRYRLTTPKKTLKILKQETRALPRRATEIRCTAEA